MNIQEFDYSADILRALLWQYNRAPKLTALLEKKQTWYDVNQSQFWSDWFRDVFDLRTANAFGLQVWARILKVPLQISVAPSIGQPTFGFGGFNKNFNRGNFSNRSGAVISLTIEEQRLVLQLRYFKLITRPSIPEVNRMLKYVFPNNNVYALDPLNMTSIVYVFDFQPGSKLTLIFDTYELLPRPSTVGISYTLVYRTGFGFGEFRKNFDNGNFNI